MTSEKIETMTEPPPDRQYGAEPPRPAVSIVPKGGSTGGSSQQSPPPKK